MFTLSLLKLHPLSPSPILNATPGDARRVIIISFLLFLIGLSPLWLATPVAAQGTDCGSSYTVRSGDVFSAIAKRCGVTLDALKAANPQVKNIHQIKIGQLLVISSETGEGACGGNTGGLDVSSLRDPVLKELGVSIPDPEQFDLKVVPLASYAVPPALIQSWGDLNAAPDAISQHFVAAYTFNFVTACWKEIARLPIPGVDGLKEMQVTPDPQSDSFEMIAEYAGQEGPAYLAITFDGQKFGPIRGAMPMPETQPDTTTPNQPVGADSCDTTTSLYPSGFPETLLQLIRCEQINDALKEFWDQPFSVEASENYSLQEYSIRFGPGVLEINSDGRVQIPLRNEGDSVYRIIAINQSATGNASYLVFTVDQNGGQYRGMVPGNGFDWRIIYGGLDHLWLATSSQYSSAGSSWTYEHWYDLQQEQFTTPSAEFVTWTGGTRNSGPIFVQTLGYPQLTFTKDNTPVVTVGYDVNASPSHLDTPLVLKRRAVYMWDEPTQTFIFDAEESDVTEEQVAVGFSLASESEFLRFAFDEIKENIQSGDMATRTLFRQFVSNITEDSPEKRELLK